MCSPPNQGRRNQSGHGLTNFASSILKSSYLAKVQSRPALIMLEYIILSVIGMQTAKHQAYCRNNRQTFHNLYTTKVTAYLCS